MNKYDTQAVATKSTVTNNTYDNAYGSQDSNNNRVDSGYTSKIASPDVYSAPFNAPNSAKDTDSTNSQQQQQQQHTNLLADPRTNSERAQLPSASTDFRPPTKEEDMAGMNSLMALASVAAAEASSLSQQINTEKRKSKYDIPAIRPGSLSATAAPAHAVDHQALYDKYERSSWMFSETASQKSEEGSFYDYVPGDFTEFGEKKGLKRRERNREAALLCRKKKKETLTQIRDSVSELAKQNQDITNLVSTVAKDVSSLQSVTNTIESSNKELEFELERLSCQYAMAQRLAISQAEQGNASMLQELTKVTSAFTTSSLARENMSGASNQQNENTNKEEAAEVTDHTLITHGHVHNLSCRITCKGDEMSFVSTASPVPHYA